jgi:hypothetical protein
MKAVNWQRNTERNQSGIIALLYYTCKFQSTSNLLLKILIMLHKSLQLGSCIYLATVLGFAAILVKFPVDELLSSFRDSLTKVQSLESSIQIDDEV